MRRSILNDLPDWVGWPRFLEMLNNPGAPYPEDSKLYTTVLFETGCRRSEAVQLRPEMFAWNKEAVLVRSVPVVKKGRRATRDIVIKIDGQNPLASTLIEYVGACETKYLFPGRKRFTREIEPWRPISAKTVWNRVNDLHPNLWPHALRGYRASMLVYERGFSVQDLIAWFNWQSADMALHYTKTRDMATSMGIKELPRGDKTEVK